MGEIVAIWYRGATYQLGRGRNFYGIWPADVPGSQPFERWPLTPEGWYGAWSRFAAIETPGTIVPASEPGMIQAARPGGAPGASPAASADTHPVAADTDTRPPAAASTDSGPAQTDGADWRPAPVAVGNWRPGPADGPDQRPATAARRDPRAVIAAALLAVGVGLGIIGLFPHYLDGASLAQQATLLVPHVIYLAAWSASALLILLGGTRLRAGALLGTGMSIVTFGFFLADAGTVIAGGSRLGGAGLVLGLIGWLACAAGSVLAFLLPPGGWLGSAGRPVRPRGRAIEWALALVLAALGAAVAFVPAWDSYTLRTAGGTTQTLTAGYAFANPGAVIAGNVAVMVGLVAVAVAAAVWRPRLLGAALLAGAAIPMAAQAISAVIQIGAATSPAQFGISPAQAALAGLRISSGLTPAFWIYSAFVVVLAAMCVRMLVRSRPAPGAASPPRPAGLDVSPPAASTFS